MNTYSYPAFPYVRSAEQASGQIVRHPVVVIGAGPIGLTAALDMAYRGVPVVLVDDNNTVSVGSRAVCYAKRPLEIWDRLGCAAPMVARGISWKVGKVFFRDDLAYQFDLLPEADQKQPAMINLQQYYLEETLVARCAADPRIDVCWKHKVVALQQADDHVRLTIETPDGIFQTEADWVIACDGANSDTRRMVGATFTGQAFQDRFLIADVVMKADFPTERWFWFDPPFHRGQSVLLHRQSDNLWRIDFQLGWDADPEVEKSPEQVIARIKAMLGDAVEFELEWVSIYQFACRRIDKLRHGRVLFAGDAAHQVSPFGARGANTGVQDVDNLAWKLALVVAGDAPPALLDTYHAERAAAADDNIAHSTRSTDFITPKSSASRIYRDAVLELAREHAFARPLVNSGRLSTPTPYAVSPLNTPDRDAFDGGVAPGTNAADAPVTIDGRGGWLLEALAGGFTVLTFGAPPDGPEIAHRGVAARVVAVGRDVEDAKGLVARRYAAEPGTTYLLRPDQHVAARWRAFEPEAIRHAMARALGYGPDREDAPCR
ncbi:MAG: FAD-dependent oxidoreductase [Hyphomicrobiaceae bacterium]